SRELWKAVFAFQAAVGIRGVCGFPSVATVSTGLPFLSFLLLFSFFVPFPGFPQKNFAPGTPRNDDRQFRRPAAYPLSSPLLPIPLIESKSPLASGSPMLDADVRDCKKQNTFLDWLPLPARPDSPSDKPPQAFDENVVGRSPLPVHADVDALSLQPTRELL